MRPKQANGYVLNVPPARREALLDADGVAAEPVQEFVHSRSHPLICFVSFEDGAITHLALARKGMRAGTDLRRLNLDDLQPLNKSVPYSQVLEKIPGRVKAHVARLFETGGVLPPGSFSAVVEAVRGLLPESNPLLDRFSERRRQILSDLGTATRQALAYQKETVATAMALAGIDRKQLQNWQPLRRDARVASFLDGLPQVRLREDQMLLNDFTNFPGFDFVRSTQHGSAVFEQNGVRLTVVMANRNALEEQTGADLIYCNETYGSFVVVQYKAMEQESSGAKYRLPNEQLAKELQRMESLGTELQKCATESAVGGFRLADNPFFLKLCPRLVFDPDDTSLIGGMYIPITYWRRLEADPGIVGSKNGLAISYQNVGRYLTNTSFSDLVANGWIGTTGEQTKVLKDLIRDILMSNRTVTLAVKSDYAMSTGDIETEQDAPAASPDIDDPLVSLSELTDDDEPF